MNFLVYICSNHGSAIVDFFSFLGRSGMHRRERSKNQKCIFFAFMIVSENRAKPLDFLAFLDQRNNRYCIVDFLAFAAFPYPTLLILTHFEAAAVKSLDMWFLSNF